jgi:hypothetical protein
MSRLFLAAVVLVALPIAAMADGAPQVILRGEVGDAVAACNARFRFAPFDSLAWLRADLTGEQASKSDDAGWGHVLFRPFKNYSGDISGRFIEIMAMDSHGDPSVHPAFHGLLDAVARQQRPGGYFCASGVIDWQQAIDHAREGHDPLGSRMLPALWGNARLLCGLVEAMRAFPEDKATAGAATALGDFFVSMLPRFNDPGRIAEYTAGGSYAAGYVTCWFPTMEGLVKLGTLTGQRKYADAAAVIAEFYRRFDRLPIDHAHGMLCGQVSLLLLYEATGDDAYLARVERRWDELVQGGFINPAGGILERCRVSFVRDEGCAIVDWLRLNLALARVTGKARYWAMAERTLHNHFLQNQASKGGFGHRRVLCDAEGAYGFGDDIEESTWCCSFHGELGFIELRRHLLARGDGWLACRFALDFSAVDKTGTTTSVLRPGLKAGEVLRQRISLAGQPATVVRVRQPHWADAVTAVDPTGAPLAVKNADGWCATSDPVNEVEFVYAGGIYAENRRCMRLPDGPRADQSFVMGYGPKLLAAEGRPASIRDWPVPIDRLATMGLSPLKPELRRKSCSFVVRRPGGSN